MVANRPWLAAGGSDARFGGDPGASVQAGHITAVVARFVEAEQERLLLWAPVFLGLGVAAYFTLPAEPALLIALVAAALPAAMHIGFGRRWPVAVATAAVLMVGLGFSVAKLRTEVKRAPVLAERIGPVEVQGWIELVEPRPTRGQRLTIRVTHLDRVPREAWPVRVRVRTLVADPALSPGIYVRVRATLSAPSGPAMPGDFDFARLAWFRGLGGIGIAAGAAEIIAGDEAAPWPLRAQTAIERMRQAIGGRVTAALPGETGAIANALITGERGGISEATNQAYRDSGIFHILSISGLHMVIMAGAVFYSIRLMLAAVPAIALRFEIKKWAAVAAILGALGYLLISGSAFATVRSYIMISIMFLAVLLDRPALALRNVALAALAILLVFPESLFDAGFQMSFAAVVALISTFEWLRGRRDEAATERRGPIAHTALFFAGIVGSTLIASLAVAPLGIYHFHASQQYAILANLIAIPICNIVVMPAALATLVVMPLGIEGWPLWAMGMGIEGMTTVARRVAALPGAVVKVPAISSGAFLLMVAGGLWLTLWQSRLRLLGLVPLVIGLLLAPNMRRADIYVGRDAQTIAVRAADGRLSVIGGRDATFELSRWLEYDGDARSPGEVAAGTAFRCDALGCIAAVNGLRIAVADNPAALVDDCAGAAVVVARFEYRGGCGNALVIDRAAVRRQGTHAVFVDAGKVSRFDTVARVRGARPWVGEDGTRPERAPTLGRSRDAVPSRDDFDDHVPHRRYRK